jgi:predicted DNA-binding transcriptional regulator YafY
MRVTRQRSIVERLRSTGLASTEELAALCDVSVATVRRDLIELESAGALRVCGLDQFDALVTTQGADGPTLDAARAAGTEVHVV